MNSFTTFAHPTYGSLRALIHNGKPFFFASDVCRILALPARKDTLDSLDPADCPFVEVSNGGGYVVSRAGVYALAFESGKSYAKAFVTWLSTDVIPSLSVDPDSDILVFSDPESARNTEAAPDPSSFGENLPQVFSHDEHGELRVFVLNDEPWFVAADVCKILDIVNVGNALSRLDEDEKNSIRSTDVKRGNPNITIVSEPGLYSLVLSSRKPQAKAFKRWITHEVIPSIRKHGAYMTKPILQQVLNDPNSIIQLASTLLSEHQRAENLQQQVNQQNHIIAGQSAEIEEMRPKVSYLDTILQNKKTVPVSIIAKDYGMSAVTFNKMLNELGIQYKCGRTWLLYSRYASEGYTTSYIAEKDGDPVGVQTNWTQKGRLFLYNTLKSRKDLVPLIERESA